MFHQIIANDRELWEAYEGAIRGLLWRVQPRHLQRGVNRLLAKARGLAADGIPPAEALWRIYRRTAAPVVDCWRDLARHC